MLTNINNKQDTVIIMLHIKCNKVFIYLIVLILFLLLSGEVYSQEVVVYDSVLFDYPESPIIIDDLKLNLYGVSGIISNEDIPLNVFNAEAEILFDFYDKEKKMQKQGILKTTINAYQINGVPDYLKTKPKIKSYRKNYMEKWTKFLLSQGFKEDEINNILNNNWEKIKNQIHIEDDIPITKIKEEYKKGFSFTNTPVDYFMMEDTVLYDKTDDIEYNLIDCPIKLDYNDDGELLGIFETKDETLLYNISGEYFHNFTKARDGFLWKERVLTSISDIDEDILYSEEVILKFIDLPVYLKEPFVKDISSSGIEISWITNRDTSGKLFFNREEGLAEDDFFSNTFYEKNELVKEHSVIILFDDFYLDSSDVFYFRSKDKDHRSSFIIESSEYSITKEDILNRLRMKFDLEYNQHYKELIESIENTDYKTIEEKCTLIKELIKEYEEVITLTEEKKKNEKTDSIIEKIMDSIECFNSGEYAEALENYEKALGLVEEEYGIYDNMKDDIEKKIELTNNIIDILEKEIEADDNIETKDYIDARMLYNECLEDIEEYELEDYIPPERIEEKLSRIPAIIHPFYIRGGSGIFLNINNSSIFPLFTYNILFGFRLNKSFVIGGGVNLFFLDIFVKYSFLNNIWKSPVSHELAVKADCIINFIDYFGMGFQLSIDYTIYFGEYFSLYSEVGFWTLGHFGYEGGVPFNIFATLGFSINFG